MASKKPRDDEYRHDEPAHSEIAIRELFKGDDRTTAIVGATVLDNVLERVLRLHFVGSEETVDKLFGYEGALGSFSAKIDMCAAVGIIGETTKCNLHLIRQVRNKFSHTVVMPTQGTIGETSFKTTKIADWCDQLQPLSGWNSWSGTERPEYKFREACVVICYGLLQEAEKHLKKPVAKLLLP